MGAGHVERRRKRRGRRDRGERQRLLFGNAGFLLWMQHKTVACPHESTTERHEKGLSSRRIIAGDNRALNPRANV